MCSSDLRLRSLIQASLSGLTYKIDLMNEGANASQGTGWFRYLQRMWGNYGGSFGTADTVGFSIAAGPSVVMQAIANNLSTIYTYNGPPSIFDFHGGGSGNDTQQLVDLDNYLTQAGHYQSLIIGEAPYNNSTVAAQLRAGAAAIAGHRTIWYLTQWPDNAPAPGGFLSFSNYFSNGF